MQAKAISVIIHAGCVLNDREERKKSCFTLFEKLPLF